MEASDAGVATGVNLPADVAAALQTLHDFIDRTAERGGPLADRARERAGALVVAEATRRVITAGVVRVIAAAERDGDHLDDGHRTVRPWIVAAVNTSPRDALADVHIARLADAFPQILELLARGRLGVAQARALAAAYANPRITDAFTSSIDVLVDWARSEPYDRFVDRLQHWINLVDADGAHRDHDHTHHHRRVHLTTTADATYLDAMLGTYQGAEISEILDRFTDVEFHTEWDRLAATHGDQMNPALLERSPAQRRADALVAIFRQAAATKPGAREPEPVVNIVIPQAVFEEQLAAMIQDRPPVFPNDGGLWCATTSGLPVDPAVAVTAALVGHVRRVVVTAQDVIIGFGTKRRLFTGSARTAAAVQFLLQTGGRCLWPGCGRRRTEIDHTNPHHQGGMTDLHNAGPLCAHHNRIKNHGYRTWRDRTGRWHTTRPDGTTINAAA